MSDTKWYDLHCGRLRPRPRARAVPVDAPTPEDMARLIAKRKEKKNGASG